MVRHALDGIGSCERKGRVLGHVDRHAQRRHRASLPDPHLEQPEAPALDGELDVAQIGVVALQQVRVTPQLVGHRGQALVEDGQLLRSA